MVTAHMESFGSIPVLIVVMTSQVKEGWRCVLTGHGGQSVTHHLVLEMLKLHANNWDMMIKVCSYVRSFIVFDYYIALLILTYSWDQRVYVSTMLTNCYVHDFHITCAWPYRISFYLQSTCVYRYTTKCKISSLANF